jgi:Fe-Mn family superoxide dismutase
MSYSLPLLPYKYEDLEPYFDRKTMEIHHLRHHQTYVKNTNIVVEKLKLEHTPIESLITSLSLIPNSEKNFLRNNAGGHANHSFFWQGLKIGTSPCGDLKTAIEKEFGSIEAFQNYFEEIGMSTFGSGWVWLIKSHGKLEVASTANQDNPLMGKEIAGVEGTPIIGLDVWEHAYYLKYQNKRIEYIKSFWKLVDWNKALTNFSCAK